MNLPNDNANLLLAYRATRETVGIAHLSDQGILCVSGADRVGFLQNLISNDIHLATENRGIFATLLTAKGKLISAFDLYKISDAYWLTMETCLIEKTHQYLMRFRFRSKIEITTLPLCAFLVAGPHAKNLMDALFKRDTLKMDPQSFFSQETDPVFCVRQTQTGEEEYHLYFHPEKKDEMTQLLVTLGAAFDAAWILPSVLETIRLEAGIPRYGVDMTEEILPNEAGLEPSAISYTKGCYPGQEVIARIQTYGHINKHRMGIILEGSKKPSGGEKIFSGDQEAGWVIAATDSPFIKKPIATAYLKTAFAKKDQSLTVMIDDVPTLATVIALPFYPGPIKK
ncbi:MAG: glycine cleavage T C-terminal barrel domain-containing protein [Nitrospirota bacterium]